MMSSSQADRKFTVNLFLGNNRNTNSNRNKNRRQHAPMPSAGGSRKLSESALGNELSDFTLDDPLETTRGRNRGRSANHLVSFQVNSFFLLRNSIYSNYIK